MVSEIILPLLEAVQSFLWFSMNAFLNICICVNYFIPVEDVENVASYGDIRTLGMF